MDAAAPELTRITVAGMDCGSCAAKIETALGRLPEVVGVTVSLPHGLVEVTHRSGLDAERIRALIRTLGFRPLPPAVTATAAAPWWRRPGLLALALCGGGLGLAHGLAWGVPQVASWVMLVPLLVGWLPVLRKAVAGIRHGTAFSIETLMSLAVAGALLLGAWDEAATVVFLFLLGEALEGVAAGRARAGIAGLTALLPKRAWLRQGGNWVEVPADALRPGDVVRVAPGERVPVDGVVEVGQGSVDEAVVSGESLPRLRHGGDPVFAGSVSLDGLLEVRALADSADSTMARVARLVEQAQASKAPIARVMDRFARWYTPLVMVFAVVVMVGPPVLAGLDWSDWIYRGLAVLLIGCPCALVISTPAAVAAGLAAGARIGLLIKSGAALETLARVSRVAFDKTGTLTEGRPQVTDLVVLDDAAEAAAVAAGLCAGSTHPLAQALVRHAVANGIAAAPVSDIQAEAGRGLVGRWQGRRVQLESVVAAPAEGAWQAEASALTAAGKTVSVLAIDGRVALVAAFLDTPRDDAAAGIDRLRRLGISMEILTGDQPAAAAALAGALRLPVRAALLPADKLTLIRQWQYEGLVVAKVGDGINDAPALAAADVGIAMASGAEIALDSADAALVHGRVGDVAAMIALARATLAVIRQNVALALLLKGVFLVTTLAGMTGLWPAVLADTGATVLVTANSLRLLGREAGKRCRLSPPPGSHARP